MDGARAPWWRPQADAAFVGLSGAHGPTELARAIFEAVARDVVRCLALVVECRPSVPPPAVLHLAGAGASSSVWRDVLSGISGLPVDRRRSGQAASAGAALLASSAVGEGWELERLDPVVERSVPDPAIVEQYDRLRDGADHVAATLVELGTAGPVGPAGPSS
jgi:xylulokinase